MAKKDDKHPYTSSASAVTQMLSQLRRIFPQQLTSDTLKKLAIAPNNESHVLNVLRFLKIIDDEGNKNLDAAKVFSKHHDGEFQEGFAELVRSAYAELFQHYGEDSWSLSSDRLISFFRGSDHTSDLVGRRQTTTFQTLALLAGKLENLPIVIRGPKGKRTDSKPAKKVASAPKAQIEPRAAASDNPLRVEANAASKQDVGLTVRIEINLPAGGDQETYDNIFKSIRENLLNGKPA